MSFPEHKFASRRQFLKFLSGSPLLAYPGFAAWAADAVSGGSMLPDPRVWAAANLEELIANPKDAINVFDFEPVARKNVPPAHFGYMASGIDDEITLRANREGFLKYYLRPRRLNDVSKIDMSTEIFGVKWDTPIIIAPTGGNKAHHPEGEIAVARAARAGRHLQILSSSASTSVEAAAEARGAPIWFQLYATQSWDVARQMVKRVEAAGCPVVAVTVDRLGGRNQETFLRLKREDARDCGSCHKPGIPGLVARKPIYDGIDLSGLTNMQSANMTWDFIRRLKDTTRMKVVIKGILTHEDATLCVTNGADGLIVSNHGGRSEDGGPSTIEVLPEIVQAVAGRIPVLVDGGFRRGSDILKALAIGANGICVARPYLWGLGAFGEPGVERVMEILRTELRVSMQQCGVATLKNITPALVRRV